MFKLDVLVAQIQEKLNLPHAEAVQFIQRTVEARLGGPGEDTLQVDPDIYCDPNWGGFYEIDDVSRDYNMYLWV